MTDWPRVIQELMDAGVTQREISERAQCSQATISELKTGRTKSPRYEAGVALIELYAERCGAAAA